MNDDNYQEDDSSTNGAPEANTDDQVYQEILTEIDKQQSKQKSWVKNILVLAISLYIFFQLGFFEGGLQSVVMLIVVLLIHETGHLIGMRLFGYTNVQMFFIPFFGAAVSGESRNVATYKKAFISLLGPMPGIIIGCVLMFMYATTGRNDYLNTAGMFLIINCFNLLPFFPLDGGRFLYLVIFSRNRFLELCFKIFAALALMLVGYALGAWLLALLGLFGLLAVKLPFRLSKIAKHVRQSPAHIDSLSHPDNADPDRQKVPLPIAKVIIDSVYEYFPPPLEISTVALHTKEIWEKVCFRPSGVFSTIVLLIVYLFAFCLPPVALFGAITVSHETRMGFVVTEILEYQQPDGSTGLKEQVFFYGKLNYETEVDPNSYLYHGKEIYYRFVDANTVQARGTWCRGKLDGPYNFYDEQGDLIRVTVYDNGNFVSRKVKVDGQWTETKWEDLSFLNRWKIRRYKKRPRGPAKRQQ
jgi:Zn-dependent protease